MRGTIEFEKPTFAQITRHGLPYQNTITIEFLRFSQLVWRWFWFLFQHHAFLSFLGTETRWPPSLLAAENWAAFRDVPNPAIETVVLGWHFHLEEKSNIYASYSVTLKDKSWKQSDKLMLQPLFNRKNGHKKRSAKNLIEPDLKSNDISRGKRTYISGSIFKYGKPL